MTKGSIKILNFFVRYQHKTTFFLVCRQLFYADANFPARLIVLLFFKAAGYCTATKSYYIHIHIKRII